MSLVIKKISFDLSEGSIERAIQQIKTIQNLLYPALKDYVQKLAEKGVEIARAELVFFPDPAYYTGQLSESVRYETTEDGAVITAGEGLVSGYPSQSYAMFVEHGTGVFGADLNDHGWDGWWYLNPNDGKYHHTVGMPPRPFMHNTYEDLIDEIKTAGGQIIAEYLRDYS